MFPYNNQTDLSTLLKDYFQQDNSHISSLNHNIGLNQNNLLNSFGILQHQNQAQLEQQQHTNLMLQEKINNLIQQQQLQLQQQQLQLSGLAALSAQLQNGNAIIFNNSNTATIPTQNQYMPQIDNMNSQQINTTITNNQSYQYNATTQPEINQISNNIPQQSFNNSNQSNQPSFNYSSTAQNMIFTNLQNQMTTQSSKSIIDSCSDISANGTSTNQSHQKTTITANQISNQEINISNPIRKSSICEQPKPSNSNNIQNNSNKSNNGRWTREEHLRFVKGLGLFGKNWKKVEDYVGSRSGAQIRSHAQKFFNKIQRENTKNSSKGNGKNGNSLNQSNQQEDYLPSIRKRQQSGLSNFSVDLVSDEGEGDNDQQNPDQYSDIIPEQSKQKEQNQSLTPEQIQQMEEQLKKIQIFIQVLSACDNIGQPNDCASPTQQNSNMGVGLNFSLENLNINSPLMTAQPSEKQPNRNQDYQNQKIEINNFSLQGNQEGDKKFCIDTEQKTPNSKSQKIDSVFSANAQTTKYGSTQQTDEQECSGEESQLNHEQQKTQNSCFPLNSGGIIQNKLKLNNNTKKSTSLYNQVNENSSDPLQTQLKQKYNNTSACSASVNINDSESKPMLNNIHFVSDNIDIEADFTEIKNLQKKSSSIQNSSSESNLSSQQNNQETNLHQDVQEQKNQIIIANVSPSLDIIKNTPTFSVNDSPHKNLQDFEFELTPQNVNDSAFKLEPSFFIYFMKKYGKYFDESLSQAPKLSDLVNMNSQQYEQDCIIEEFNNDNRKKSSSISTNKSENSPELKRRQAAERAQNFMDLEDDYGSNELPIIRKKQSSFSAYQNTNKGLLNSFCQNNKKTQLYKEDKNASPIIEKYQKNHIIQSSDKEKQQNFANFRKKVKTTEFTSNPLLACLNQAVEQNNNQNEKQAK